METAQVKMVLVTEHGPGALTDIVYKQVYALDNLWVNINKLKHRALICI